MPYTVYTLSDPRTPDVVRYVGATSHSLKQRLANHCTPSALRGKNHKAYWVGSLKRDGLTPYIEVLEEYSDSDSMFEGEDFWIENLKFLGCNLVNGADGGRGSPGPKTEEHKAKLSLAMKGRQQSAEAKQKVLEGVRLYNATHTRPTRGIWEVGTDLIYRTLKDVAKAIGCSATNVHIALKRGLRAGGKELRWADDYGVRQEGPKVKSERATAAIERQRKPVLDLTSGNQHASVLETSVALGVNHSAVSQALKRGNKVKGHHLTWAKVPQSSLQEQLNHG